MSYKYLSKSKIVRGMQCQKSLYLSVHSPELEPEVSESQQAVFDLGHEVGAAAQKVYPGGVLIAAQPRNPAKAYAETLDAMAAGECTIYEATFLFENVQVKVDILHKEKKSAKWKVIEVKSSTSVKDVHLNDMAIQAWVAENSGLKVSSYHLMHINSECRYPDLKDLFEVVDVTEQVLELKEKIPKDVKAIKKVLLGAKVPDVDIGPHCDDPYECSFKEHCWKEKKIPELSVFDLPGMGKKAWGFYQRGKIKLSDLVGEKLSMNQQRAVDCYSSKKRHVNAKGIKSDMSSWEFPFYYLDFETIAFAIPKYKETGPYMQIPFQFSCHVETKKGALSHFEFLNTEDIDPRLGLVESLVSTVGDVGSVVSYNKGFEAGVMRRLADEYPKYSKKLNSIIDRLVDPLPIFKAHVYDNAFAGSFSIKAVAPALIGEKLSYDELEVGDGSAAQRAYLRLIDPSVNAKEKTQIKKAMIEYCKQDTLAMVELVRWLRAV
ncbi:MAG: DUF2779 domain-containing protein [Bdellovibrionota bacterium]